MKRGLMFLVCLMFLSSFASATIYHVTQNGGVGSNPLSVAQFNSLSGTGYAGDTFYFSGSISSEIIIGISGTLGGQVTLDGYEAGNCDPINSECTSSALVNSGNTFGIAATSGRSYITVQDFRVRNVQEGIYFSGGSNHIIVRRSHTYNNWGHGIKFPGGEGGTPGEISHVIVGGAPGDGNFVEDAGNCDGCGFMMNHLVNHMLISHNKFLNTNLGNEGVINHQASNFIIERNDISNHINLGTGDGQGLASKSDEWGSGHDYIMRFNNIHDSISTGIVIINQQSNAYVYGNLLDGNSIGIAVAKQQMVLNNVYLWANVVTGSTRRGVDIANYADPGSISGVYVYNNVIEGSMGSSADWTDAGFRHETGSNINLANNIFKNNLHQGGDQEIWNQGTGVTLSNNQYYYSNGPAVLTGISKEGNSYEGDPRFTSGDDFTLQSSSPARDAGTALSQCFSIDFSGGDSWFESRTGYGRYIQPCLSDALDPSTNWQTVPPTVISANQNSYGAWERGAYVYTGGTTTYSCTGSIPSNAAAFDSEESTGLTANTPWTFSATDTATKCQYHCNTGYNWDGSACVAQVGTCPEGQITSTCSCGGISYSSGYCCSGTWQSTSCTPQTTSYTILKTTTPPTINGDISEFADANEITLTSSYGTTGYYKFLWDSNYLYVAAEVYDTKLNALITQEDGNLYEDDSLELMFDTANNRGQLLQNDDYKFFVNVNNAHADSQLWDSGWDSGMNSIVNIGTGTINNNGDTDTKYVIEARIPWANWETPINDEVWGMNLALNDKLDAATYPSDTIWLGSSTNVPDDAGDVLFSSQTITPPVTSSCTSGADSDYSNSVSITELINYIGEWKSGSVSITELINAIGEWKAGC